MKPIRIKKSLLWLSAVYSIIIAIAIFDQIIGGGLSNEGAAGLSLLAHLPALPLSYLLNVGLESAGKGWMLAPFNSGLANVVWIAIGFWGVAALQWLIVVRFLINNRRGQHKNNSTPPTTDTH